MDNLILEELRKRGYDDQKVQIEREKLRRGLPLSNTPSLSPAQKVAGTVNRAAGQVLAPDYRTMQPAPAYPSSSAIGGVKTGQAPVVLPPANFKQDVATGVKTGVKQGAEELAAIGKGILSLPYQVGSGWGQALALPFGNDKAEAVGKWFETNRKNVLEKSGVDVAENAYKLTDQ